jgi:precorrin-3B C17-methyltransferase
VTESGSLRIVGLGPGGSDWMTPEAALTLERATDIVGYEPYVARVPERPGQQRR